MRILITSGGTKVPIDSVRDITNMSKGTFGANIATEAMMRNHHVTYFCAKGAVTPFTFSVNLKEMFLPPRTETPQVGEFLGMMSGLLEMASQAWQKYEQISKLYEEEVFRNYSDYASSLEKLVKNGNFDVVILAAAVSDYVVKPIEGKIRSSDDLTIQLIPAEKLISKVKIWNPDIYLVGFKLLVNAPEWDLADAAEESIEKNKCDMVIANDLAALKAGNHRVMIMRASNVESKTYTHDAKTIIRQIEEDFR